VKCHYVGVDVGAKELVVSIDRNGSRESGRIFTNDAGGQDGLALAASARSRSINAIEPTT
jgi:hypothetical protein